MEIVSDSNHKKLFGCCVCGSHDASKLFAQCLHTICTDCVSKVSVDGKYLCNICNQFSEKLITNGVLSKINSQNQTPNCVWCTEGGESNISQGHCKQCNQWLCNECIKGHNRMPPFRSHTITIVGDCGDRDLKCEIHPRESLELYCETCGVLTCRDCQLSVHRDHGGHRWVKEKAELLRPGLQTAVESLEAKAVTLCDLVNAAAFAPNAVKASATVAKLTRKRALDELIETIGVQRDALDSELDSAIETHVERLNRAHGVMENLSDRIDYTLRLARSLIENETKDPASLVQLAESLKTRLTSLADQVSLVATDGSAKSPEDDELREMLGWRESAASRVVFLPQESPADLVRAVSSVWWTKDPEMSGQSHPVNGETKPSVEEIAPLRLSGGGGGGGGCAVCRASGRLIVCSACERAFHPACHLPRVPAPLTTRNAAWTCSLCSSSAPAVTTEASANSTARIRDTGVHGGLKIDVEGAKWTQEQFETGCRILLSLLCHPEAARFTASNVCPVCCISLAPSPPDASSSPGDASVNGSRDEMCELFHGLARLRQQLEAAVSTPSHCSFETWIRDIDTFVSDACSKAKEFEDQAIGDVYCKAASTLRDNLDSSVQSYCPTFFKT